MHEGIKWRKETERLVILIYMIFVVADDKR